MKFLVIGGIDLSQNKETEIQLQYIEKCKELLAKSSTKRPTFHIQNEGCQMNSIQTESIAAIMEKMGYEMVDTEDADAVVFNTCTVRENANQKIYGHLGHLKSIKRNHPDMKIVLLGCKMQEHHVVEKIRKDYKYVNLVIGTHNIHKIPELFYRALQTDDQIIDIWKESDEIVEGMPTSRKYSFKTGVSVMFGCNNFCSYCIVPYVRGREKSREPQAIIREIEELVADGVTEIMLLGQNVNSYGKTLETPVTFSQLLKEVEKIEGLRRIRFMTSHPKDLSDELIQTMKEEKKICHYLDLPIQHASDRILKRMGRRTSKQQLIDTITKLRKEIPDIALRTTLITGFPGETQEQHEEVMEFVDEMEFERLGVFTYSPEEDTPAATMPDQIDEEVKEDRQADIMELQQEIVFDQAEDMIGKEVLVMIEGKVADENAYVGRTYRDAPNVDGLIFVNTDEELMTGDFAKVKVTGAAEYDLIGELI